MPLVTVLYFAQVGERIRLQREALDLPDIATSADILAAIAQRHPQAAELLAHCRLAMDLDFVSGEVRVLPGAELAVIPPVSGG